MSQRINFHGIIPPLVTPLDEFGAVDRESVRRLVEHVLPYSTALMPTLSSGEGWALSNEQLRDMVTTTKQHAGGKPVLVGALAPTTAGVVQRARMVLECGADAVVVTTPFTTLISQEEIVEHFRIAKEATGGAPLWIYNEELISKNAITVHTMQRIVEMGNIVGIKEASGSVTFLKELLHAKLDVPIFQGWESLCLESVGVDGYVLPLSNIEPALCEDMFNAPTPEKQQSIHNFCAMYHLLGLRWYAELKKELHHRGIISTITTA